MDARPSDTRDLPTIARERVRIQPAPEWIVPCPYDADFKTLIRGPLTYLLLEQQVHAELGQTYVRRAVRLESMQAVQHQSQWRVEFEPQTQSLILHSIRVRRGSTETEHASLDRLQFLQREAGLEGFVIDGWITLLLLLEDVSPGDVLEWSYTLTNRPHLLPEHVHSLFPLPAGVQIGKHHFSIRHAQKRALNWKSSAPELAPTIIHEGEETRCFWLGEKLSSPEPEQCMPAWCIHQPWMQVSDCPDWQAIACAVLEAWKEDPIGEGLARLTDEAKNAGPHLLSRINRAVELVQDGFRYLSVSSELGGQIPAPVETVVRRRYGDCKDLAFLLVRLLRALGIAARPVLVHSLWQKSISRLLPSPGVFNHVVVEFEIGNERRWVDVTLKNQGGGALNRFVPDYGLGLPIAADTSALAPVPAASLPSGSIEIKESFLLDTNGGLSSLAIVVTASGINAESFRMEFENEGVDAVAKKRLQLCANRFSRAARVGSLLYRDDRERNEFVIAESFQISGFLTQDDVQGTCLFYFQTEIAGLLLCPPVDARRTPFALPFPCQRVHIVEIDFAGMNLPAVPLIQSGNEFFSFSRRSKVLPKFLRTTFSFSTRADAIPPEKVPDHRKHVEPVWQECSFRIRLPTGYMHMRPPGDFGALPPPTHTGSRSGESATKPVPGPAAPSGQPAAPDPAQTVTPQARSIRTAAEPIAFIPPGPTTGSGRRHPRRHRRDSDAESHGSRGRSNRRCSRALYVFLGAMAAFVIALLLSGKPEDRLVTGFFVLASAIAWLSALVLAVVGLVQCVRHPDRYRSGKVTAIITLAGGALFGLVCILPIVIYTAKRAVAAATGGSSAPVPKAESELLQYAALNFVFHAPGPPWRQVDANTFGAGPVLALARPEPMYFTVTAGPVPPGPADSRTRTIALSMANLRRAATSFNLIHEGDAAHHNVGGRQIETEASIQGHEYYLVHWLTDTNGFGYQLVVWGPVEIRADVKKESDRLFECFELTNQLSQKVAR